MIYVLFSGGASPSPTATDFATQNQLHLCKAQTSLRSNFTWCSQTSPHHKVPAVRKKAPSGRELAAEQTEGERDGTIYHKAMVYAPMLHAISFRLAMLDTSLPEGGYREEQAPPLPALILHRKINFTCAKHKLHCEATSLGEAKLHRTTRCPSPTGTTCRIRRMAVYHQGNALYSITLGVYIITLQRVYHQGNALYIISPWCASPRKSQQKHKKEQDELAPFLIIMK